MATFLTRVELHAANADDYEKLHEAMRRLKFSRTITAGDGAVYQLPTAEYLSHGDLSSDDVRDLAISAAKITGRRHWVLTSEYTSASWLLKLA